MRGIILLFCLVGAGCQGVRQSVDHRSFRWFGGTIFSEPGQVTMKEIHLDSGNLLGHEVIVEGTVVKRGEYFTHLIISDETARMLVVLTNMDLSEELLKKHSPKMLRVLGTVERGKKGLPFVLARALNPMQAPKS